SLNSELLASVPGQFHDHATEQLRKLLSDLLASLHHFFVVDGSFTNSSSHVGDARDTQNLHAHLASNDSFGNSAHAHGISAKSAHHVNLRRRLIAWTRQGGIDAATSSDVQGARFFRCQFL